ncbi:MAG TPA: 5-formyltetrahydrofolate cyclo-ligase [Thermoplasmatales archaeon]|nr:5-formyltetrahydrofolate cyclo-ligase [Thermoplasmatales archaeon]
MKNALRKRLLDIRKKLSHNEVLEISKKIEEKLFSLKEFQKASTILFYVSYDNEVYTHDMIKRCLHSGKNIVVPVSDTKNEILILSKLENWHDLEKGSYGILEPKKIIKISPSELDLIIVPGVGFDEKGNRLGHGKGYYDKLLQKSNVKTIGLAFECQIVEKITTGQNDIPVDIIITEKRIINITF